MKPLKIDYNKYLPQVEINRNDPGAAMNDNAAMLAYYGGQEALWSELAATIKQKLEDTESALFKRIKESAEGKAPTDKTVEAEVSQDENVQKLKKQLSVANGQLKAYTNACRAFADRGNNARSLNTTLRNERANTHNIGLYVEEEISDEDKLDRKDTLKRVARG